MAKKKAKSLKSILSASDIRKKLKKALSENRTKQALELARSLNKQHPSDQHAELLQQTTLARGQDLLARGQTRDASEVFSNALKLSKAPAYMAEVLEGLARCGEFATVRNLYGSIEDPVVHAKLTEILADEAVRQGKGGANNLDSALRSQHTAILDASALIEKGADEQAKEKLQAIGLKSPFLQWKLFLRGLSAYYQQDDERAIENWQRLDSTRWPFKLAAPLRFGIDQAFAKQQSPETQTFLRSKADAITSGITVQMLRKLQTTIGNPELLPNAFRTAATIAPQLRSESPAIFQRLANCFYWAIIHHGEPGDVNDYKKIFGAHPDDPKLARLEALACEDRGIMGEAHTFWQTFEKSVASNPNLPKEHKDHIRALVWQRMGENADNMPDPDELDDLGLPFGMPKPKPLKPSAAECYEKSLQLAPDLTSSYVDLFHHYRRKDKPEEADRIARTLLERNPNHVLMLEEFGDFLMETEAYEEALELFNRAMKCSPLEKRLREKVATAQMYFARSLAEAGEFEEARELYKATLAIMDKRQHYSVLCKMAALEFKAKNADRAEELIAEAEAMQENRMALVFSMLVECIRAKLTKIKPRFHKEFDALLKESPTPERAVVLANASAGYKAAGVKYYGQQTHEKKIRTYLDKAHKLKYSEEQLREICFALGVLNIAKLHMDYILTGQKQYPKDPFFYMAEVQYYLNRGPRGMGMINVHTSLKKARALAEQMPRSEHQQNLLNGIQQMEQELLRLNPFMNLFGGFMGGGGFPFGGPDDFYDDFDDEYYDDGF